MDDVMKKRKTNEKQWISAKRPSSWKKRKISKRKEKEKKSIAELKQMKKKSDKEAKKRESQAADWSGESECPPDGKTLSIAVPGSILDNAQTLELKTYLAGQIARAAAIFCVDEIIVYDDEAKLTRSELEEFGKGPKADEGTAFSRPANSNFHMARILQFLECPQYIRRYLFPLHKDLQYAGLLNPLDCPHHLRQTDSGPGFREGVVLDKPCKPGAGSFCYIGLPKEIKLDRRLPAGLRVTIQLDPDSSSIKKVGKVVSPRTPLTAKGAYWGYSVRVAASVGGVLRDSPFPYDLVIGTSDKGQPLDQVQLPPAKHWLVVFGGLRGLEAALEADESLASGALFHEYLNTCPGQGSRTIRTEEALLITLAGLTPRHLPSRGPVISDGL